MGSTYHLVLERLELRSWTADATFHFSKAAWAWTKDLDTRSSAPSDEWSSEASLFEWSDDRNMTGHSAVTIEALRACLEDFERDPPLDALWAYLNALDPTDTYRAILIVCS